MQAGRPSSTAESAAMLRAAHQLLDQPRVLDDAIALRLVGPAGEARLRANLPALDTPARRHLRAFMAARSRHAEEELRDACARGVRQYVVLGAGLDSFAYRNPFPGLRVFEVDHPDTQAWKRGRLAEVGIAPPASLTFVAVDLERARLAPALAAGGFDIAAPACVAWLGVTPYLTREAIFGILADLSHLAPGSAVVFEYLVPRSEVSTRIQAGVAAMAARASARGEPWLSSFAPAELAGELTRLGFAPVEDLGPDEIVTRYFAGRTDGLRPGGLAHLITARVASRVA
jgi:methyltransferase (TIGR00027 family)